MSICEGTVSVSEDECKGGCLLLEYRMWEAGPATMTSRA